MDVLGGKSGDFCRAVALAFEVPFGDRNFRGVDRLDDKSMKTLSEADSGAVARNLANWAIRVDSEKSRVHTRR